MKLVDLKNDGDADDFYGPAPDYALPQYPWGVRLCLTNDELEKLGITGAFPPVGAMFTIAAVGRVVSTSEDEAYVAGGEPRRRVEIQIMQMGLDPVTDKKGAQLLYSSVSDAGDKD